MLATLLALPVLAAAPPDRTVTGTAVDAQGQPVAGAEVWLPPDVSTEEEYAAYLQGGPAAVTGADGRFTVSVREDMERAIDVCAPGSLTEAIDPSLSGMAGSLAAARPLTVVVRPGARIFGRVVDASGDPMAGISVGTALAGSNSPDFTVHPSPCHHSGIDADAVTDPEGRFTLAPLEPGWYTVSAGDGRGEPAPVRLAPGQVLELRLAIERGAQISGRVTAQDGSPVPRATVFAGSATTEADAEGRYQLNGVPPGSASVMAVDSEHGAVYRKAEVIAGDNRLDLVLPDPIVIHGRVLRPRGGPAAGATVAIDPARTATAADGTFRLSIPSGRGQEVLTVRAGGLAPAEAVIPDQPGPLDLPAIHLVRPGSIAGHVTGLRAPAGTRIVSFFFAKRFLQTQTVADAAGRFRLPALAPGSWVVSATHEGRTKMAQIAVTPGAESTLDLAFPPTHLVSGWVVDHDGQPVACDAVVLGGKAGQIKISAPCGPNGAFAAETENGSYEPSVNVEGRHRFHEPLSIEVAGAPVNRVEIRLLTPVTVSGHTLGLAPGEIPNPIQANRIGETSLLKSFYGTADQDGGYRLEILPGDWEITALCGTMTATRRLHVPEGVTRIDADLSFASKR